MDMQGEYRIPASRETVWEALNDPEVLKASITGCQSLEKTEDGDGFTAKVTAKVGPVKATFGGSVRLENVNAPESYTIVGEGKGGAAGFAKGSADVNLEADGDDTVLRYTVKAQVGGKLAQLGARLVDSTAHKYAKEFFDTFAKIAAEREGRTPPGEEAEDNTAASAPVTPTQDPPDRPAPESEPSDRPEEPQRAAPEPTEEEIRVEATRAATEAAKAQQEARKASLGPFRWILLLIAVLLGLTLLFGGDTGMMPSGPEQ